MSRLVIASARRRLWIANAYFSPPDAMLRQLEEKVRQRVEVRVLAPGPVHDVPLIHGGRTGPWRRLARRVTILLAHD